MKETIREKQNIQLAVHEQRFGQIEKDITEINTNLNNHVNDLHGKVDKLTEQVNKIDMKLAFYAGAIVVAIWVLEKFFP